jgi:hypothetical protein
MNIMLVVLIVAAIIVGYFLVNQYIKNRENFGDVKYIHSRIVDGERIHSVMYPKNFKVSMNEKYNKCKATPGCIFDIHPVEF